MISTDDKHGVLVIQPSERQVVNNNEQTIFNIFVVSFLIWIDIMEKLY